VTAADDPRGAGGPGTGGTDTGGGLGERAGEMRRGFDDRFAAAPKPPAPPHVDLLRIRLGGAPYAIAAGDIAELHVGLAVVPLPSPAIELLGVAAVRGQIVPVYDLRRLIGVEPNGAPRWILRIGATGLAFDGFDGQLRVAAAALAAGDTARPSRFIRGYVTPSGDADRHPHGFIDLAAVVAAIRERWSKES
jgi:chemotaxis signal transduction protein